MKKIFLIAAFFVSTGIISSCTKENNVTPVAKSLSATTEDELSECQNCLGTGDGGVDRPTPPKKP
ncbi:hypothetical protein MUGA111182_12320 [Mucilaginibacter galii]|uniref:Lipoprotein n=1 Tax=Mucilaginibacter galii TaxID=2005073 RepID=A0A917JDB8_9SPHI|nr:hypothetical protein [Mucilaginibacter galii]GGI52001.1 hypothetical protein GCM10011425_32130 [Mucilaginibacter galii]